MRLIQRNPGLSAYLLNSLNGTEWFEELLHAGLFRPEHNPPLKEIQTADGTAYQAEGWPALRYLERVASRLSEDQARKVMEIVRAIAADSTARASNNWRTAWSLATVVAQLPTALIQTSDIETTRQWLLSAFDNSMVGAELGRKLLPRLLASESADDAAKALLLVDVLTTPRRRGADEQG
jgi:hypothetical protein